MAILSPDTLGGSISASTNRTSASLNNMLGLTFAPLAFASLMAFIDTFVLSGLKKYSTGDHDYGLAVPLGMLIYSLQPLIFLQALRYESMTVMNIMWDMMSDLYVTLIGLFYFKERLTTLKMLGLSFAFIAIVLLSYDSLNGSSLLSS